MVTFLYVLDVWLLQKAKFEWVINSPLSLVYNGFLLSSPPFVAFTLFQLVAVGSASFFAAALLSGLAFSYCHHLNRPSAESAVIHPSTPNHLTYNKQGNATPKNEKYIPMEFKVGYVNALLGLKI